MKKQASPKNGTPTGSTSTWAQEKKNIQCTIYNHVILYKASITALTKFGHISLATEQIIKYKLTSKNNKKKYTLCSKQWLRCHFHCLEVPKQRSASLFFYIRLHHQSFHNVYALPMIISNMALNECYNQTGDANTTDC